MWKRFRGILSDHRLICAFVMTRGQSLTSTCVSGSPDCESNSELFPRVESAEANSPGAVSLLIKRRHLRLPQDAPNDCNQAAKRPRHTGECE
jgi:hypothetical protein